MSLGEVEGEEPRGLTDRRVEPRSQPPLFRSRGPAALFLTGLTLELVPFALEGRVDPLTALRGVVMGIAITLLCALWPLWRVRAVRPAEVLRQDVAPPRLVWPESPAIETLGDRPGGDPPPGDRRDFPPAV